MKRSSITYVEKPQLSRSVARRPSIPAKAKFPQKPRVEIARLWTGRNLEVRPKLRTVLGKAIVAEVPPGVVRIEPPNIKATILDRRSLRELTKYPAGKGYHPKHLPLVYKPEKPIGAFRQRGFVPDIVFPPDSRYVFQSTAYPWSTVGRVKTNRSTCTGTMVGPRHLLTASHCIDWLPDGTTGWLSFAPAYYNGPTIFGEAWGVETLSWRKITESRAPTDDKVAFDYAVVILDRRIGDLTGWAGYATFDPFWLGLRSWQNIGYPRDLTGTERPAFSEGPILSTNTQAFNGQFGQALGHRIDTSPGHSGGPYWGWFNAGPIPEAFPRVTAVDSMSPSTTAENNRAAGGEALSNLITWALANRP